MVWTGDREGETKYDQEDVRNGGKRQVIQKKAKTIETKWDGECEKICRRE